MQLKNLKNLVFFVTIYFDIFDNKESQHNHILKQIEDIVGKLYK